MGKPKTANNYMCALKHFRKFRASKDLAIGDLSVGLMCDFQRYLTGKGLRMNTISLYNRALRAVYHYALTGQEKTCKRALTSDVARALIQLSLSDDHELAFACDLFLFSLYMQGMPFVDIAHLTKKQLQGDRIVYQRRKTNQHLEVCVLSPARAIIERYGYGIRSVLIFFLSYTIRIRIGWSYIPVPCASTTDA